MANGPQKTFLIEKYVPQLDEATAIAISARFRAALSRQQRRDGTLRWVRSFALFDEETFCCVVAASDVDHIVRLSARSDLEYDHVAEVVLLDHPGSCESAAGH